VSRVTFGSLKPHQEKAVVWARRRLADRQGRCFTSRGDQDGVLFADSVGMGKTWEALGASALLLYRWTGKERGRRHVLVLCPANLVTKWEDELEDGSGFRTRLSKWAKRMRQTGDGAVAKCVEETLSHALPIRRSTHVQTRLRYGRVRPQGGTYIVSQSLFRRRGRGLGALRRHHWNIVICDEAHTTVARKSMDALAARRRDGTRLLLSATPFQLEPRQFNELLRHALLHGHRVLNRKETRPYISAVDAVFRSPATSPDPAPKQRRAAQDCLRRVAARTVPPTLRRVYSLLLPDGAALPMAKRLDELDNDAVAALLEAAKHVGECDHAFERAYLRARMDLAAGRKRLFVATSLRRALAGSVRGRESPRRRALGVWARRAFEEDIRCSLEKGLPRKSIVFTTWVGGRGVGEAEVLRTTLLGAWRSALGRVRALHGARWIEWRRKGRDRLAGKARKASLDGYEGVAEAMTALARDELASVLAGRFPKYAPSITQDLARQCDAIQKLRVEIQSGEYDEKRKYYEKRTLRRRLRERLRAASPDPTDRGSGPVARYTGSERRSERDRAATAFRRPGPPWVLVASNVGAEGIDLHTFTARVVHYDLEWNPARMEQREGRGDRVGRRIPEPLQVLYCIVPGTYDERMLHQLVARDRWHGVLLGKGASRLAEAEGDAPLLPSKRLRRMRLDLRPRN
jgi:superfamily II DNA or RNA helicase